MDYEEALDELIYWDKFIEDNKISPKSMAAIMERKAVLNATIKIHEQYKPVVTMASELQKEKNIDGWFWCLWFISLPCLYFYYR